MNYDIIIIGGGLGGLTAGAKLAKEGKKVLLLEQHDRPGGCATTFRRKDYTMEVGLHEMDGLHRADPKTKIFNELGVSEKVVFLEVPEFYRFVNKRYDLVISHNPEEAKTVLVKHFPSDSEGIEKFFYSLLNARKISRDPGELRDKSLGQFLDEIIRNEDLKLILLGNLGYFHDDPYSLSLLYYLNAQGAYFGAGRANFVQGGSQKLSDSLMEIILENGGTVLLKNRVTKIGIEKDKSYCIYFTERSGGKTTDHKAYSPEIVVNAALPLLAEELLPEEQGKILAGEIAKNNTGASLLTVYFGFKKELKLLGNRHYSFFIYDDSVKSMADILHNNHSDFNTRSFTFVDYSQLESKLAPKGKSVGAVCCVDYLEDWAGLDRQAYMQKKKQAADAFISRCEMLIPGFAGAVEHVEVATARTVRDYTLNPGGAVYGFAQNPGKSDDYLRALPENIYVASAWGKFGGGFSGAILGGYMAALDVMRKVRS